MINRQTIALENEVFEYLQNLEDYSQLQIQYKEKGLPFVSAVARAVAIAVENAFTTAVKVLAQMALDKLIEWLKQE